MQQAVYWMISTYQLSFSHARHPVIADLSTHFSSGKVHAILGANGAGKSTLLKLLAGELIPQRGHIYMNTVPLSHLTHRALAQIRAVLPQNPALNFSLKVRDIVEMGTYPFLPLTSTKVAQLIHHCLSLTDTQHLVDRLYLTLSGGEQQRIQLSRTLVQILAPAKKINKRFLFLDEPTTHLDPRHQHHILQLTKQLATEHDIGIIVVLHDVNLAIQYADTFLLLANSGMVAHGSKEILTAQNLERVYYLRPTIMPHPLLLNQPLVLFQ
jgi:iron complex transport system ATP-binding protein